MGEVTSNVAAVLIGLVIALPAFGATPDHYQCRTRHDLVGPCWTVHGRLSVYNGAPMARIWPIGTHRLLGVDDQILEPGFGFAAPKPLRDALNPDTEIFADFQACPLTKSKPGVMQLVCISGAKHIRVERVSDDGGDSKGTWEELPGVSDQ